jgi:hypothetical protein
MGNTKRIGDVLIIENTNKITNADSEYYYIRVQMPDGSELPLMFTDYEFNEAIERAKRNPEDVPETSWIRDLLD